MNVRELLVRSEVLATEMERLAAFGTLPPSAYTTALKQLGDFDVALDEADLFVALSQHAYDNDYNLDELSIHSWEFAKEVGAEAFAVLVEPFYLAMGTFLSDLRHLLNAGMTAEEIATHECLSDGTGRGFLTATDVLTLRMEGLPGAYYSGIGRGLDWAWHPRVAEVLKYYRAGIPVDYVRRLLASAAAPDEVLSFWEDGIPVEYAVLLVPERTGQ